MTYSIVCPLRNEMAHIGHLVQFITSQSQLPREAWFIDGMSTDGTYELLQELSGRHDYIKVLQNPEKIVPFALNKAIPQCTGDIIIRLDAHTDYASDYIEQILKTFTTTETDIAGGPMRIAKGTLFQQVVGLATSSKLGIGNSSFHFESFRGYTDSVYLGAWKKTIFEKTGLFDTRLKRNQDDEFHYRAKSMGFRIYQNPDIRLYYYPRNSFSKLFIQYYQYGLFKPLVLRKIKSGLRIRHIIPSLFVLYLTALIPAVLLLSWLAAIPLGVYLIAASFVAIRSEIPWSKKQLLVMCFPVLHIAYGSGFIFGLFRK